MVTIVAWVFGWAFGDDVISLIKSSLVFMTDFDFDAITTNFFDPVLLKLHIFEIAI